MLVQLVSLLAAAASIANAQSSTVTPAPKVTGNPAGASYVGTLPEKAGSALRGSIAATTENDGSGVRFSVSFSGLPAEGGPFMYHIHAKPVPADGNCTGTGAHLDPYMRGEVPACDASKPETCQTGDLSGKHGNFTAQSFSAQYVDPYLSTSASDPSFFGDLSFVVHLANKTRIGCANFTSMAKPLPSSGGLPKPSEAPRYNSTIATPLPTGGAPIVPSASATKPAEFPGAAAKVVAGPAALLALVAALAL